MLSFFKKNKSELNVPEWCSFFNNKEYEQFLTAIEKYFQTKGMSYELGDGVLNVKNNEFGFQQMGLGNVSQQCRQTSVKEYFNIVEEHFNTMVAAKKFDDEFETIINDFEKVKQYLVTRLYPDDYIAHIGKDAVLSKQFGETIQAMIAFDLPNSVINVKPNLLNVWDKTFDEVFAIGIENVLANNLIDISKIEIQDGISTWFAEADHFFTPSILLDLQNRKDLLGKQGALIGIPHRHVAIIYPIDDLKVVQAVNTLIPRIYQMHHEGPGSLSPDLFWYHQGELDLLEYEIQDNKLSFRPPENFIQMLNQLKE